MVKITYTNDCFYKKDDIKEKIFETQDDYLEWFFEQNCIVFVIKIESY